MYGLINKSIKDLIVTNHGNDTWNKIKEKAGIEQDIFITMQAYDDSITYDLMSAASEVLNIPTYDIMVQLGEFWIKFTSQEGYGSLFKMGGDSFIGFLNNLNNMHLRLGASFTESRPPSFSCWELNNHLAMLAYRTHREGLAPFVIALLQGLGNLFEIDVKVTHVGKRAELGHDEFMIEHHSLVS